MAFTRAVHSTARLFSQSGYKTQLALAMRASFQDQGHSWREKVEGVIYDFDLDPVLASHPSQRLIPAGHNQQNPP